MHGNLMLHMLHKYTFIFIFMKLPGCAENYHNYIVQMSEHAIYVNNTHEFSLRITGDILCINFTDQSVSGVSGVDGEDRCLIPEIVQNSQVPFFNLMLISLIFKYVVLIITTGL
jgi:hypothetical protein